LTTSRTLSNYKVIKVKVSFLLFFFSVCIMLRLPADST